MTFEFMDKISKYIPVITPPKKPLSLREKMVWTAIILGIYFLLYNTYAIGVNITDVTQPVLQLISIIFAARIGSIITVGIGPIVLSSIVLQLLNGSGIIHIDMDNPIEKGRFQSLQKFSAIAIAVIESVAFVLSGYVPVSNPGLAGVVMLQLALGAIAIIFMDEMMSKYGITSGINMFIAAGVSYAIVAGTATVIFPEVIGAITAGGAAAPANAVLAFGPLIFAIIVFLVSIYAYEMKIELPLSFGQMRGVGGRLPIPFLYVSVLPVILATALEESFTVWFKFLSGITGSFANFAKFIAYYQNGALSGGLVYLISPSFPLPYSAPYGIGGYLPYFSYLLTHTSDLFLPMGGMILVPEWIHVIVYIVVLEILCVVFGKFWIEMTGQNPEKLAQQLQDMGWQIPGFRRDPRMIKKLLDKYIPDITVLGSLFVGLLAAIATLTGAIGTGMGILLTVGIIYMVYQQLEQENLYETYPILSKIAK
ncbi:preprotein translocase subunit SecY [Candidatus Mancarchaeum acidiphilum]|uniref:Preprotein translocase subunit SecY n=1 Tax=Candidatus Mancarchaeum acidiphilum TaxID=1920749 RepID=A0A218NNR2_9ARCH|nr:hypothetical protein [Candidatus Mancarchaeum acidiphilum]ASI14120.1 preprotein translocase subunit SecY [Candidatus Mancarchaeum acidiphilum]